MGFRVDSSNLSKLICFYLEDQILNTDWSCEVLIERLTLKSLFGGAKTPTRHLRGTGSPGSLQQFQSWYWIGSRGMEDPNQIILKLWEFRQESLHPYFLESLEQNSVLKQGPYKLSEDDRFEYRVLLDGFRMTSKYPSTYQSRTPEYHYLSLNPSFRCNWHIDFKIHPKDTRDSILTFRGKGFAKFVFNGNTEDKSISSKEIRPTLEVLCDFLDGSDVAKEVFFYFLLDCKPSKSVLQKAGLV